MLAHNLLILCLIETFTRLEQWFESGTRKEAFLDGAIAVPEVKSGAAYKRHASLDAALRNFPDRIGRAIVLSGNNYDDVFVVIWLCLQRRSNSSRVTNMPDSQNIEIKRGR